ncbi:MAG TPA: hypothetical protein VHG91_12060, partial [Longimicrobium sp.]|nr:hypothetical protein [Longimicrobium sp.]
GHAVVADSADLARLRVWPQCRDAPIPPLAGRTLVGLSLMGDCHAMVRFDAFRSESRRELRVRVQERYGGCRAGGYADAWLLLPPLPEGWSVRFTETGVPDDTPLGTGWIYLRSAGNPSAAALRLWERP